LTWRWSGNAALFTGIIREKGGLKSRPEPHCSDDSTRKEAMSRCGHGLFRFFRHCFPV